MGFSTPRLFLWLGNGNYIQYLLCLTEHQLKAVSNNVYLGIVGTKWVHRCVDIHGYHTINCSYYYFFSLVLPCWRNNHHKYHTWLLDNFTNRNPFLRAHGPKPPIGILWLGTMVVSTLFIRGSVAFLQIVSDLLVYMMLPYLHNLTYTTLPT